MPTVYTPLSDRVLIQRDAPPEKIGSILIAEVAKEKPNEATVIAVGPKVTDLQAGDKVLFGRFSGVEVRADDQEYLLMREDEILSKITRT